MPGPLKWLFTFLSILREDGPAQALLETAKHFYPDAQHWYSLLQHELSHRHPNVPILERVRLLRRGYISSTYHIYDLSSDSGGSRYVSKLTQIAKTGGLNGSASRYLDDKRRFHRLLSSRGHRELLPRMFAFVEDGVWQGDVNSEMILDILDEEGQIVVKEATGSGGSGVLVCEWDGRRIRINSDEVVEGSEFLDRLDSLDAPIVTEHTIQAGYAANLHPGSANTIRALTIHPNEGDPFLPVAAQRIGTEVSEPVDSLSRGGVAAPLDARSGEMGRAWRTRTDLGPGGPFSTHPDTGRRIEGTAVPGWQKIREGLLALCRDVPELCYVGWDVLVTAPGEFSLLEGNNQPGEIPFQLDAPLLANDEVRSFYRKQGVV